MSHSAVPYAGDEGVSSILMYSSGAVHHRESPSESAEVNAVEGNLQEIILELP